MFHQISTIFLIILSFDQGFGQSCTNPGNCREYNCCKDVNEGQLPDDPQYGINCTSQIPNRDYEVRFFSLYVYVPVNSKTLESIKTFKSVKIRLKLYY
jgi:hypothetical protein